MLKWHLNYELFLLVPSDIRTSATPSISEINLSTSVWKLCSRPDINHIHSYIYFAPVLAKGSTYIRIYCTRLTNDIVLKNPTHWEF